MIFSTYLYKIVPKFLAGLKPSESSGQLLNPSFQLKKKKEIKFPMCNFARCIRMPFRQKFICLRSFKVLDYNMN